LCAEQSPFQQKSGNVTLCKASPAARHRAGILEGTQKSRLHKEFANCSLACRYSDGKRLVDCRRKKSISPVHEAAFGRHIDAPSNVAQPVKKLSKSRQTGTYLKPIRKRPIDDGDRLALHLPRIVS